MIQLLYGRRKRSAMQGRLRRLRTRLKAYNSYMVCLWVEVGWINVEGQVGEGKGKMKKEEGGREGREPIAKLLPDEKLFWKLRHCRHHVYLTNCWHRNLTRNTISGNDAIT